MELPTLDIPQWRVGMGLEVVRMDLPMGQEQEGMEHAVVGMGMEGDMGMELEGGMANLAWAKEEQGQGMEQEQEQRVMEQVQEWEEQDMERDMEQVLEQQDMEQERVQEHQYMELELVAGQ